MSVVPKKVDLAEYAKQGYPDLRRGMIITVQRPFQFTSPFLSLLSWRIRVHSETIARQADPQAPDATESHAMIYAGAGRCWSQDSHFEITTLQVYKGCTLHFFDNPNWQVDDELRHRLMSNCGPHAGESYGYGDIAGLWAWAVTGKSYWMDKLGDKAHWFCSEATTALMREVEARAGREFLGQKDPSRVTPQTLYQELQARGWPLLSLELS